MIPRTLMRGFLGRIAFLVRFRTLPNQTVEVGGQTLYSFVLDMGSESFDCWLTERLGAEIRVERKDGANLLDVDARELVLPLGRSVLRRLNIALLPSSYSRR